MHSSCRRAGPEHTNMRFTLIFFVALALVVSFAAGEQGGPSNLPPSLKTDLLVSLRHKRAPSLPPQVTATLGGTRPRRSASEIPLRDDPCQPSPCGPNSQCKKLKSQAVCSCDPNYIGVPPNCRPECTAIAECPEGKACSNQRCVGACDDACGVNAECKVVNNVPVCYCPKSYSGDPFSECFKLRDSSSQEPSPAIVASMLGRK